MFNQHEAIVDRCYADIKDLLCHEQVVQERLNKFIEYLNSLETLTIVPSIIICNKTNTILDGHHRYHALKILGFDYCPVTKLRYDHPSIIPHLNKSITKQEIIDAASNSRLLSPKSSYHHFIDDEQMPRPIILLSFLSDMKRIKNVA